MDGSKNHSSSLIEIVKQKTSQIFLRRFFMPNLNRLKRAIRRLIRCFGILNVIKQKNGITLALYQITLILNN